jgi:hypothetical protein
MGILANQAMQRLRVRVAELEAPAKGARRPLSSGRSASIAHAAIALAGVAVIGSAAIFVQPNTGTAVQVTEGIQRRLAENTGRAAFPLGDGRCRELVFDRNKSNIVNSNTAPCDSIPRRAIVERSNSASNGFIWGRQ